MIRSKKIFRSIRIISFKPRFAFCNKLEYFTESK
jgi:hypothetical protein